MENLRLHFPHRPLADHPLGMGVHRMVREASGTIGVGDQVRGALLARICMDQRGLWLQVANGMRGVHVNGRPVKRMALLRAGDAMYVDGVEVLLQSGPQRGGLSVAEAMSQPIEADPRRVLRGVGGPFHGRSFPLDRPCLIGRAHDARIRIEDSLFAERHAQVELHGDRVLLHDLGSSSGTQLNGVLVRDALLVAGDQLTFDGQHRFVVEVPWGVVRTIGLGPEESVEQLRSLSASGTLAPRDSARRWPWLLLTASALAALLSALLLFGAG